MSGLPPKPISSPPRDRDDDRYASSDRERRPPRLLPPHGRYHNGELTDEDRVYMPRGYDSRRDDGRRSDYWSRERDRDKERDRDRDRERERDWDSWRRDIGDRSYRPRYPSPRRDSYRRRYSRSPRRRDSPPPYRDRWSPRTRSPRARSPRGRSLSPPAKRPRLEHDRHDEARTRSPLAESGRPRDIRTSPVRPDRQPVSRHSESTARKSPGRSPERPSNIDATDKHVLMSSESHNSEKARTEEPSRPRSHYGKEKERGGDEPPHAESESDRTSPKSDAPREGKRSRSVSPTKHVGHQPSGAASGGPSHRRTSRSPPRGPRNHPRAAINPSHAPPPSYPTGPRLRGSSAADGGTGVIPTGPQMKPQLPLIPIAKPKANPTQDLEAEISRLQAHRANLLAEYAQIAKDVRRARHELEMATIDLRAAENRRRIADGHMEKARAGVLGIDAVTTSSESM